MSRQSSPVTLASLRRMKQAGEKFSCLTSYDAAFTRVLDEAGVDVILVGDSLGMVIQGHDTTVPVTMDDMVYHSRAVAKTCRRPLLMVDMPFMAYASVEQALVNATRLMQEGGAQVIKLEGDGVQLEITAALARRGIPVCAHLGLQPQVIHKMGGYRVQGRDQEAAEQMLSDAIALQNAGADLLLLECVPEALAARISREVAVPVIGIGAGAQTDAQVLVLYDLLDITPGKKPKFAKAFISEAGSVRGAVEAYVRDVASGAFPAREHWFD
ncbi:MAG TPA: 3-methyl-2-oxobutanoate hydroxymethyltransferase [Candidatus Tenderia sp.]|nr:3-methyl-2-oxobutanoate hydroxymethyltransferase [Candidatus Tenderia sp.]